MKNKKTITVPIYQTVCVLYRDPVPFCKATGLPEVEHDSAGMVCGSYVYIGKDYCTYDVIAHESYHLALSIMKRVGADHAADEEVTAYLVGYLTNVLMMFYLEDK